MDCAIRSRCMILLATDSWASTTPISSPAKGGRYAKRQAAADHWHRTGDDEGRPYRFVDADTLLMDFFREARRILAERGIGDDVTRTETESET